MIQSDLTYLDLFSGIGGFRKAIELYCEDNNLNAKCVGFSEIDRYATLTYKANFETSNEVEMGDIENFTSDTNNIKSLPDFDLLCAGFPCQSFSMMGEKKGFEDERGNLFYNIIKILLVKQPKYILLENVRNIKTHDNGDTYKEIIRSIEDDAGYHVTSDVFNTSDFGLPQTRRRMFFFAVRKDKKNQSVELDSKIAKEMLEGVIESTSLKQYKTVLDNLLEKKVDEKFYLSEKMKRTILSNGSKGFKSKSEINQLIARPLTATMVKMHRACQDNYYSDEFLQHSNPFEYAKAEIPKEIQETHRIRRLTPIEALKLQGFDENFYQNCVQSKLSNHQIYKQSGNAVSVNTVYSILIFLFAKKMISL